MAESIAVYGGAFDPVHAAHLRAAQEAAEEVGLDRVLFMPCAQAPHPKSMSAPVEQRLEMLRLATVDNPCFGVSELEAKLGGTSFTVNTLEELHRQRPNAHIYFLIGADAFFHVHTWHQPRRLFELADFVVMARPKSPRSELVEYMQTILNPEFKPNTDGWVRLPQGYGAKRVSTTLLSISSTDIRRRVTEGLSITYLVPNAVEDYIKRMKLYQDPGAPA